jgi:hypothetical protein
LEPLADSLQTLEKSLSGGGAKSKKRNKKNKKRALTAGEDVNKNVSTPVLRLA